MRHLAHKLFTKHQQPTRTVWVAVRVKDGRYWAGEWKWYGRTFTSDPRMAYLWARREQVESTLLWGGWEGVVPVEVDYEQFARRPQKRRYNHYRRR